MLAAGCGGKGDNGTTDAYVPPADATPALLSRQEVVEACLRTDGCGVMPYGYLSYCVTAHYDDLFTTAQVGMWTPLYRCVNAAGSDCPTIRACFGGGTEPASCMDINEGYCDGHVRAYCDTMDRKIYMFDCWQSNQTCCVGTLPGGEQAPFCGYGEADCADYQANCTGALLLTCDAGYVNIRDCAALGLTCGQDTQGIMGCVGRGVGCMPDYQPRCEGNISKYCAGGHLAEVDCTLLPGNKRCIQSSGMCGPSGNDCVSGEQCDGSVVELCLDGHWVRIDCQYLGFRDCVVESGAGVHCRL